MKLNASKFTENHEFHVNLCKPAFSTEDGLLCGKYAMCNYRQHCAQRKPAGI